MRLYMGLIIKLAPFKGDFFWKTSQLLLSQYIIRSGMSRNNKLNFISLLLATIAIIMISISFMAKIPAPGLTGTGFFLIIWAIQELKK